ncbi:hypothetical protein EC988_006517, partial [Linderina pennispora]
MSDLAQKTADMSINDKQAKQAKKPKAGNAPAPQIDRPEFIEHRNRIFDELYAKQQQEVA